jgi:hypothetical protein
MEAKMPKKEFKGKKRTMSEDEADYIYRKAYGPPPGEQ